MKLKVFWGTFAIIAVLCAGTLTVGGRIKTAAEDREVKPSPVFGYVADGCFVYDKMEGKTVDLLCDNTRVEIIKDVGTKWYYVRYGSSLGWVKGSSLDIPPEEPVNRDYLDADIIEDYANRHFPLEGEAPLQYVWVDIDRQRVYVLEDMEGEWKLKKTIICSTGKNESPTIRGNFVIQDRGEWFYSQRLGSGAMYWVRFNGSYLFHSVAMNEDKQITDNTLGRKSSNGCVRMSVEDAKWFYDNVREGSGVWIN